MCKRVLNHAQFRAVLLTAGMLLAMRSAPAQEALLICIPGSGQVQEIQTAYESILGKDKVRVFGRMKDLEATLETKPDVPIIVPAPFITYSSDYTVVLKGTVGSESGQKFFAVATSDAVKKDNLATRKVGILDLLGRDKLPMFVKDLFGANIPALKRANKSEDLLTMLGMEMADAVIVSDAELRGIKSNTQLNLNVIAESEARVGFPVLAAKNGINTDAVKAALLKQPASLSKLLGIDRWEAK